MIQGKSDNSGPAWVQETDLREFKGILEKCRMIPLSKVWHPWIMIQEDPDMLKNQISPMIEKNTPSRSARRKIFDDINESKIRVCMQKLS